MADDNDNPAVVRVTLREVYSDVQDIKASLSLLSQSLPSHVEETDKDIADIRKDVSDHEKRLRSVETRMWAFVGGFGLLAAASPYLSKLFIP